MSGQMVQVRQSDRRPLYLLVRDQLEIGRECDGLLLADADASRIHACLELVGGGIQVVDLGSSNGTLVNGSRITGPTTLGEGDVVRIGSTELSLFTEKPPVAAADAARETMVPQSMRPAAARETMADTGRIRPAAAPATADRETMAEPGRIRPAAAPATADRETMADTGRGGAAPGPQGDGP